ncbi:MAG TPA: MBL fold metallo-hydrolase [Candidatus Angelobacter sp.]|nr:MBL fold metallo-hydrolase [Candidatus Angelobacter sp.]
MQIASAATWYETRALDDGVTHIWEPHIKPYYRCNMWHVRGRDRDLLVDSGMGVVSLRQQVGILAGRPILAVASHTHFDHIGAHHEFAERAVHRAEADIMAEPTRSATHADVHVKDDTVGDMFTMLPPGDYRSARYQVTSAPATRLLEEGHSVDLGDRHFQVIHLPGHSPGGIGLWEAATGILFSGDTIYDGPLIDDVVEDYIRSMERLRAIPVRVVHGGHFASFSGERFIELIDAYLAAKRRA